MRRKLIGAVTAALLFTAVGAGSAAGQPPDGPNDKDWVCHGTASESNPYVLIHVSANGHARGHQPQSHPGHLPDNPDALFSDSDDKALPPGQGPIDRADCRQLE